ncbi:MAG: PAS domain S-box protein [Paracoccaceae bacterium]|nr:PAS domain S-box protein [Paracoccaceae bacterium]
MSEVTDTPQVFEALLEAATDAIVISDADGTILEANRSAHEVFGYEPGILIGRSVNTLMPDEVGDRHGGFMSAYLETGETEIIGVGRDLDGVRADGSRFPLHLAIGHARIDGRDMFVGILHDLSIRRRVEAALEQSRRMEALGRLTGGVAHDFNNLLTIITGNLELLDTAAGEADTRDIVADALEAAQLGSALTAQLLAFARRGVLMPEVFDVSDNIDAMLGMLRRTLGDDVDLVTDLATEIWPIEADPTHFQTSILNLVVNAKSAMPEGGQMRIETRNVSVDDAYIAQEIDILPGDYVRISISDNGSGMSEETRKRAFEPFFSTKPEAQGTGLGLSLVYGFVRQSHGHVTLYSEEGQGTTFSLYFPRHLPEDETAPEDDAPPVDAPSSGNGELILVVEDNPAVRDLSVKRLASLGYKVVAANDADAALALLKENRDIRALFTDIVMPGSITGYELAQKTRAAYPHVGILLTTAYAGELIDQAGALQAGFRLLRKPYRQRDLQRQLSQVIRTGPSRR